MSDAGASHDKRMKLRYAGTCRLCGVDLPARSEAIYERDTRTVRCVACQPEAPDTTVATEPADPARTAAGVAGSSARREYERRKAKDEDRIRQKWGRLGGIAVALSEERQSTSAWATGAVGEERLGAWLDSLASPSLAVLHDRRIPGTRANIDHIAITPAGVWVIDAKRYQGRPELRVEGGFFRARVEKLVVAGRDRTGLVDGVLKQVDLVRDLLDGEVAVVGALCFVGADWPLIGGAFTTRGVHVLWPKRLAKFLAEDADEAIDVARVREAIAARLRSA